MFCGTQRKSQGRKEGKTEQIVPDGAKAEDVMGNRRVWVEGRSLITQGIKQEAREAEYSDKKQSREEPEHQVRPLDCADNVQLRCNKHGVEETRVSLSHQEG